MSQPFVSIVTPVYNGALYLRECMESVIAQTYDNWEYVVVDNCSTDGSYELAQEIAAGDERIRVVLNEEFQAKAPASCNAAMRQMSANSVYCKVVHADDWLYPNCVSEMVQIAQQNPKVGIVGSYYLTNDRVDVRGLPYEKSVFSGKDIGRSHLEGGPYLFGAPSQLLLRSDLVRQSDPFYDESLAQFDVEVCLRLLHACDFGFVHQILSYQRIHEASQSTTVSASLGTVTLEDLRCAKLYAEKYYEDPAEISALLDQHTKEYFRKISRNIPQLLNAEVSNYHRDELKKLGILFSWPRVIASLFTEVFDRVSAPLKAQWLKLTQKQWNG